MPSKPADLQTRARDFAAELTAVLNGSIGRGQVFNAVTVPGLHDRVFVGYRVTKTDPTHREAIPVGKRGTLHLGLWYQLQMDDRGFLVVLTSVVGLFLDATVKQELLHFDYERNKDLDYPEAHVQVEADSPYWQTLLNGNPAANSSLGKLHIPVGGRRFRPALEHVIEFLIREHLVEPTCDAWQENLDASRREFEGKQLRAAIWRHPEVGLEAVNDYYAKHPAEQTPRSRTTRGKRTRRRGRNK